MKCLLNIFIPLFKFCTDINELLRMNCHNFDDSLTFYVEPSSGH